MNDPQELRVLICEDNADDREIILHELRRSGYRLHYDCVHTSGDFASALQADEWQVVLSDYTMPQFGAMEALRILRASRSEVPFLVVTGSIDEETAVASLKDGADDYILKENLTRLVPAIEQSMRRYHDQKERRQLEDQLRHAQKLEAVGRLAAGVAHDFNNLLTVIMGFGSLARSSSDAAEIDDCIEHILDAGRRAGRLTKQLLAFGKRQSVQPAVVDPNHVLAGVHTMLERSLGGHITLVGDLGSEQQVWADPTSLEQAFVNLILNARDAMPGGGCISVKSEDVQVDADLAAQHDLAAGSYVLITVKDDGVGIAADCLPRIFEPFFTTKEAAGGSGLGLSTTFGIARQCGGTVHVESELGKGSRFLVYLPVTERRPVAENAATAPATPASKVVKAVLVIEDEATVRSFVVRCLRSSGFEVAEVAAGEPALRLVLAGSKAFDLVICDVAMPNMSGPEVRQHLLERDVRLPFLFTSGFADARIMDSLPDGVSFLPKPFSASELLDRVAHALAASATRAAPAHRPGKP